MLGSRIAFSEGLSALNTNLVSLRISFKLRINSSYQLTKNKDVAVGVADLKLPIAVALFCQLRLDKTLTANAFVLGGLTQHFHVLKILSD